MYVSREFGLKVARHLGGGTNEEYCEPLLADDPQSTRAAALALQAICAVADVILLYNLSSSGAMANSIRNSGCFFHAGPIVSNVMRLQDFATFEDWLNSKSRNFKESLRKARNRIAKTGSIRFRKLNELEANGFVDWIVGQKEVLVNKQGITDSWVKSAESKAFYNEILSIPSDESGVIGFVLEHDQKVIAGAICLLSRPSIEYYITAYEEAFAYYSPGSLMEEDLVKFAIYQRKDFDFRIMQSEHKARWIDRYDDRVSFTIASGVRGYKLIVTEMARALMKKTKREIGHHLRKVLYNQVWKKE